MAVRFRLLSGIPLNILVHTHLSSMNPMTLGRVIRMNRKVHPTL